MILVILLDGLCFIGVAYCGDVAFVAFGGVSIVDGGLIACGICALIVLFSLLFWFCVILACLLCVVVVCDWCSQWELIYVVDFVGCLLIVRGVVFLWLRFGFGAVGFRFALRWVGGFRWLLGFSLVAVAGVLGCV